MNKTIQLGDVADIRIGYTFREKIEEVKPELGNARVAQIKELRKLWDDTGSRLVSATDFPAFQWQGKSSQFAEPDCVLLPSRGEFLRAFYWPAVSDEVEELPVVASSQLLVIRSKDDRVLTEFIGWSLNQTAAQNFLRMGSAGSSMPMLKKRDLVELPLPIPSLETQHKILQLNRLWEQEQQLTQALLKNREAMLQGMYQQLLKEKN
ncbi:MAG: type I restriction endonuclease subunit S [Oceanospirillaceae bacterium]|uniref:restriction endonuclease subunit S n=1 Tax=unclassified Thalassolituus TaxID=2624967 RepID=UPI000C6305B7|nr:MULTISPECIES: restriction endonuclease subunit S [unclassified Thalassolituus]MAY01209.1 type I restriction endonuclease subunit S [Oceanospirillaceae bacterium]MBL33327.1 type I restriction endonuclease subunit S [Oceanospirillaceae bacterium]MBS55074.1 type I restriction endonuclease subunit S [Oceanospirillaceae bacterium]|tara:strand:- start:317 stop:937 length:621 start_codon:yes stop_codon:yes gene_type:complete